jgi:hypothetical protein
MEMKLQNQPRMKMLKFEKIALTGALMIWSGALLQYGVAHSAPEATKTLTNDETSQRNLSLLGIALLQYSNDYNGKLPSMPNALAGQRVLWDYVIGYKGVGDNADKVLLEPKTQKPYLANPTLSGRPHKAFNNHGTIAFVEAVPAADGTRNALVLPNIEDNHVYYEQNSEFVKKGVKKLSKAEWDKLAPTFAAKPTVVKKATAVKTAVPTKKPAR